MAEGFFAKFWKFFVVGGLGFGIDVAVTWLFRNRFRLNQYLANSLGFLSGQTFNFFLNRHWTFASRDPEIARQYLLFIFIALSGLGLVNGLIWLMVNRLKIPFFPAKVLAMLVFFLWNYTLNFFYTFRF